MIKYTDLTPLGRIVVSIVAAVGLVLLVGAAGAIEAGDLVTASDGECDALYEAIWRVQGEANHYTLINLAKDLDCPFENN